MLAGPFSLRYVHLFVGNQSPGTFILSKNGRSANFVGASPDDLAETLEHFAQHSNYRYFWFTYTSSADEAVELEHNWTHRYQPSDNTGPSSGIDGTDWHCTTAGCATCALSRARS